MDKFIFKEETTRLVNGKKSKGILNLSVDALEFTSDSGKDTFSISIPDLRKTELTSGIEKSLFSKKYYIDIILENNELRFVFPEETINAVIKKYEKKKKEFIQVEYQKELEVRISVFKAYSKKKVDSIEKKEGYSPVINAKIDSVITEINAIKYDDAIPIDANKAKVDACLKKLNSFIVETQRREEIERRKKEFDTHKEIVLKFCKDNYAVQIGRLADIIRSYVIRIEELAFNEANSLDDNLKLLADLDKELKKSVDDFVKREKEELDKYINAEHNPSTYSDTIKKRSRTIFELVLDNPYFILGLPVTASYNEALGVKDKIEKFAKLKIAKAFTTPFDLKNIESPNRDLSSIQAATVRFKERKYKWFWFSTDEYIKIWESDIIFEWLEDRPLSIELLTAATIHLIFKNNDFSNAKKWSTYIGKLEEIFKLKDTELWQLLKSEKRVSEDAVDAQIVKEFKDTFYYSFDQILRTADASVVNSFSALSKSIKISNSELKELVQDALVDKTTDKKKATEISINSYDYTDIYDMEEMFKETIELVEKIGLCVKSIGGLSSTYYKRNTDMYKNILRDIAVFFLDQYESEIGEFFAKKLYPLSDDADKRRLRNSFGYEVFGLTYKDLDADEMRAIGLKYHEGDGVPQDDYQSYIWMKRAADAGDDGAMMIVALHLIQGDVTTQNVKLAKEYLKKASDAGNIEATKMLINMYMPHEHYDLGYVYVGYDERKIVEVEVNFIAYVRLLDDYNYSLYVDKGTYNYYGGRQTQSPCRLNIPESGHWHLVIDNDGDDMGDIKSSNCVTRTFPKF